MGFSRYMQEIYQQNRDMLKDRKTYGGGRQSYPRIKHKLKFKESNKKSLRALREKMKMEKLKDRLTIFVVFLIIMAITIIIVF